jgi:hypothetical protein
MNSWLLLGVEGGEGGEEVVELGEPLLVVLEYGEAHVNLNIF